MVPTLLLAAALLLSGCMVPLAGAPKAKASGPPNASPGSWQKVASGITTTLEDVQFVGDAGFAVGEKGVLLKTTDGLSWQAYAPAALVDKPLRGISMVDPAVGVVTTDKSVLKTTDGGTTWALALDLVATYQDHPLRARFLDASRGWVIGERALYQTTDGGATWRTQGLELTDGGARPGDVRGVGTQAWAWGLGALYRHFDGVGWGLMLDPAAGQEDRCTRCPAAAAFPTVADAWFYGGPEGRLFRSTDAGRTWASVPFVDRAGDAVVPGGTLPANTDTTLLAFPDATHGWVLAANTLLATEDAGESWTRWESGTGDREKLFFPADVRALAMLRGDLGWAVGHGGLLARYTR